MVLLFKYTTIVYYLIIGSCLSSLLSYIKMLISNTKICIAAVHCVWDEWVFGECSAECGVGTRTNTRVKIVEEVNGGTCDGQPTEIEACQVGECPST